MTHEVQPKKTDEQIVNESIVRSMRISSSIFGSTATAAAIFSGDLILKGVEGLSNRNADLDLNRIVVEMLAGVGSIAVAYLSAMASQEKEEALLKRMSSK